MKKLLAFVGDGGSGKTTLIAELVKKHPDRFKRVITCTSRRIRVGEVDGEEYHFFSQRYFVDNPNLVLIKKTNKGDYYGKRKADLYSNTHSPLLTLRFDSISKLANLGINNVAIVCITITEELKIERMRQRGDTEEMITSRLKSDAADRANVDWGRIPIIGLEATETLDEKTERVFRVC